MPETRYLGLWSWFVRAFLAGFGAMCGVMAAGMIGCLAYVLLIGGIWAFSSAQTTPLAPAFAAPANLAPASSPYGAPQTVDPYAPGDVSYYAAAPAFHSEPPPSSGRGIAVPAGYDAPASSSVDDDSSVESVPAVR